MNLQSLGICRWLEGLGAWSGDPIVCTAPPWATLLGGMAGIAVTITGFLLLLSTLRRGDASSAVVARASGFPAGVASVAAIIAGLALGAAAGAPERRPASRADGQHVIVVVDASESATRNLPGWRAALTQTREALAAIAVEPGALGSLVLFGATVRDGAVRIPLDRLLDALSSQRPMEAREADGTAPRRALQRALDLARASRESARIVLVSDGLWTDAAPVAEVEQATTRGIRVDVIPLDAGPATRGIVASHLPRSIDAGAQVPTRLIVAGGVSEAAEVTFTRNRGAPRREMTQITDAPRQVRIDETFDGRGIQFVEATLVRADNTRQTSRLYTTVLAPPRLLVLGTASWVDRLPPGRFEVTRQRDPRAPIDTSQTDVVIIDGLAADELHPDTPAQVSVAVQRAGMGLFFVNGGMRGTPRDRTVIASYLKGPLPPILPVSPDRDLLIQEPPSRTIAIVVDASGSMAGARIALAKNVMTQIVSQMTDRDSIVIDSFPSKLTPIRTPTRLTAAVRAQVLSYIHNLDASGGSDERPGIRLIESLPPINCAAFLISDGDVSDGRFFMAGCSFNYIEIQHGGGRFSSPGLADSARRNGNAVSINEHVPDPGRVEFRYFKPEPEPIFFRNERFVPSSRIQDPAIAPRAALNGVAITFARADASLLLFRDAWPADPVLAFRSVPASPRHGEVGAFLGSIDGEWLGRQPMEALANHLERLSGWQQRDKLHIELQEAAGRVRVRLVAVGGRTSRRSLSGLAAVIDLDDGRSIAVDPQAGAGDPSTFEGAFDLPAGPAGGVTKGRLRIAHAGRIDRIPIVLPTAAAATPTGPTLESVTTGRDTAALDAVARPTLGRVLKSSERLETAATAPPPPPIPLHPVLLPIGAFACLLAFLSRRTKP